MAITQPLSFQLSMNQPIRRQRRRRTDSEESDLDLISRTKPSTTPAEPTDTQSQHDDPPSTTPQINVDSNTSTHQAIIDRIRSEINEDNYHSLLSESDYSDDTHDWGEIGELVSSDYWHFLGRYE